jgi:sugar-specific transcriptional regulator TrmB
MRMFERFIYKLARIQRWEGDSNPAEKAIDDLKQLFDKATENIQIVSGKLPYLVYGDSTIIESLMEAVKRGASIDIVTGPNSDDKSLEFFAGLGASVSILPAWQPHHFMVIDGRHVRIEKRHAENAKRRVHYVIMDYKNAIELEHEFYNLKKQATA